MRCLLVLTLWALPLVAVYAACLPLGDEQWTCSAGTVAQPDGYGGWRYSDGSSSRSDGYGGFRHSDGSVSRPDGSGGYTHSRAAGSRMGVFAASRAAAAKAKIETSNSNQGQSRWGETQSDSDTLGSSNELGLQTSSDNVEPTAKPDRFDTNLGFGQSSSLYQEPETTPNESSETQSVWSQAEANLGNSSSGETWQSNQGIECTRTGDGGFNCR